MMIRSEEPSPVIQKAKVGTHGLGRPHVNLDTVRLRLGSRAEIAELREEGCISGRDARPRASDRKFALLNGCFPNWNGLSKKLEIGAVDLTSGCTLMRSKFAQMFGVGRTAYWKRFKDVFNWDNFGPPAARWHNLLDSGKLESRRAAGGPWLRLENRNLFYHQFTVACDANRIATSPSPVFRKEGCRRIVNGNQSFVPSCLRVNQKSLAEQEDGK